METARDKARAAAGRLAPVGHACRRIGGVATHPNTRKGLKIAGGVAGFAAIVGAGLALGWAGFDGTSLSGIGGGTSGSGGHADPEPRPARLCPTCADRGVGPSSANCPTCAGTGFIRE